MYYITNVVNLLQAHVSAILVAILREDSCIGYITKVQEPMHKYKIFGFKTYGLKYMLKHRMEMDRLCGLVIRVSGCRYRGLGFESRRYQIF